MLTVHSDLDKFQVPLLAHRRPPALTLPEVMRCGSVLVGNTRTTEVRIRAQPTHSRHGLQPWILNPKPLSLFRGLPFKLRNALALLLCQLRLSIYLYMHSHA